MNMEENLDFEHWLIGEKLGEGSFGKIFTIKNPKTNEKLAMKVEDPNKKRPRLHAEGAFYEKMSDPLSFECGIPRVHKVGEGKGYNFMIMDQMDRS